MEQKRVLILIKDSNVRIKLMSHFDEIGYNLIVLDGNHGVEGELLDFIDFAVIDDPFSSKLGSLHRHTLRRIMRACQVVLIKDSANLLSQNFCPKNYEAFNP